MNGKSNLEKYLETFKSASTDGDTQTAKDALVAWLRLKARDGEDINEWAEKLGSDLAQFTD